MDQRPIDPLGDVTLHWLYRHSLDLCDCPAKTDDRVMHSERCNITKEYAAMCEAAGPRDTPMEICSDISYLRMTTWQSAIKCAECGRERLGKDLLVIYEAPLAYLPGEEHTYKYPHNIVKAVCPHHNRSSRPSYMRQDWAGY